MSIKYDIPNQLVSEMTKFQQLVALGTNRSSSSGSWTSLSSSTPYVYTSETDLMNQLKTVLLSYMFTASDFNNLFNGSSNYVTTTNSGNNYTVTKNTGLTQYNGGLSFKVKFNASNTGASTINIDSLGSKNIKKYILSGKVNVHIGDIIAGNIYILVYDGTDFILTNSTYNQTQTYATSTTGTDAYSVTFTIPYTAYYAGMTINFKADVANTGVSTLNVDGLGAKTIKKFVSQDLANEDIKPGHIISVIYDGTYFQMVNSTLPQIKSQVFTSNGTFTAPVTGTYKVTVTGGGGSGGNGSNPNPPYELYNAGGGAAGTAIKWIYLTKDTAVPVTIGAGGTFPVSAGAGNNGQSSSFGAYCSATGGGGGEWGNERLSNGGWGGVGSGGDINLSGQQGTFGVFLKNYGNDTRAGVGGSSYWGNQYGGGGNALNSVLGNGQNGVVVVEWMEV
jgi:hypothetical protein